MKRISHNRERDFKRMQFFKKIPEVRMKNRVAARDVKFRQTIKSLTEVKAVFERDFDLLARHPRERNSVVSVENVAVLAPLVAVVQKLPLKSKVVHVDDKKNIPANIADERRFNLRICGNQRNQRELFAEIKFYFPDAPHAEGLSFEPQAAPQADGFPLEPQAEGFPEEPHADGFPDEPHAAGLSPEPQAEPFAAHSFKFLSAIVFLQNDLG